MVDNARVLSLIRPGAEWSLEGDVLTWLDNDQTPPSDDEIAAAHARIDVIDLVVDGSAFRAVLKSHRVVDGVLTEMTSISDPSLYQGIMDQIDQAGTVAFIGIKEMLMTKSTFRRNSKGIEDMVEYLSLVTEDIADQVFLLASTM